MRERTKNMNDEKMLADFLTDINYRERFGKQKRNLTGQSLSNLYFNLNEHSVYAAVNIMDIYRDAPDRLLIKEIDEDSFTYDKKGNYLEGKTGDFMFEDKHGNQGFIPAEKFSKEYRVDLLNDFKKKEMGAEFEKAKKEKTIGFYAKGNKFR